MVEAPTEAGGDGYDYDVFISYAGGGAIAKWVKNVFLKEFEEWLREDIHDARVFFAPRDISQGTDFPDVLRDAHQRSKVLVAILSRQYFDSRWCRTEFFSMLERYDSSPEQPRNFIHPVAVHDCHDLAAIDQQLADLQCLRFHEHAVGRVTKGLRADILALAAEVATSVNAAPEWRDNFPVIERPAPTARRPRRPRFGDG